MNFTFVGYDTEAEIEALVETQGAKYLGGIVFFQDDGSGTTPTTVLGISGNKIHYKLRFQEDAQEGGGRYGWATDRTWPEFEQQGPRENDIYRFSGFATLQHTADLAIMKMLQPDNLLPHATVRLKPFPFPAHEKDTFIFLIRVVFPLLLIVSYLYTALSLTRALVYEKEKRLKVNKQTELKLCNGGAVILSCVSDPPPPFFLSNGLHRKP